MSHQKIEKANSVNGAPVGSQVTRSDTGNTPQNGKNCHAPVGNPDENHIPEYFDEENELHDWAEGSLLTMLVSEEAWARNWDTPEEDEAWADL